MTQIDLTKFIKSTRLANTSNRQHDGGDSFHTSDLVFIDSEYEVRDRKRYVESTATDYAIANGIKQDSSREVTSGKKGTSSYYLRSASAVLNQEDIGKVSCIESVRTHTNTETNVTQYGIRPSVRLDVVDIVDMHKRVPNFGKVEKVVDSGGSILYHTIEFGMYPCSRAENSDELEEKFEAGELTKTGKTYMGAQKADGTFQKNEEFEYKGEKYVRTRNFASDYHNVLSDGKQIGRDMYLWCKVEPIKWMIVNWDDMPKEINPDGKGTTTYIDARAEECVLSGIPFYPEKEETYCHMWQNSTIRGLLNGINVNNIQMNGVKEYATSGGGNFFGGGFIKEAFIVDDKVYDKKNRSRMGRIEKMNPDNTMLSARRKMTDTEKIKMWIDNGESVLLRGPSGIGKTQRLREMYPDIIELKLTDHMFPETVLGSVNFQEGQLIPPNFAREAIMQCANEEERAMVEENISKLYKLADQIYERSKGADGKVVILMDELLNVKPAVQSLVFGIVLNKIVESNGRSLKLPANVVIVATGNQQKFSSSASELASPLEKRFDHILDMEPKVGEWLYEYAIPRKLHPSVIGYIFSKYQENRCSEKIDEMGYFYEDIEVGETHLDKFGSRGKTNDPRGWSAISQILYNFEEDLRKGKFVGMDVEDYLKVTLESKLREEWAAEFFDFYNHPTITVEDVVQKSYSKEDLPSDINEKFATMAGLLSADEKQIEACRDFVRENCDPEYLSVYDMYWAGNDETRLELIGELQAKDALKKAQDMGFTL